MLIMLLKQVAMYLLSSTFRQTVKVVRKWVDEAEKMDGIDKQDFVKEKVMEELKNAGIAIGKGVVDDAVKKVLSPNAFNAIIENTSLKHP